MPIRHDAGAIPDPSTCRVARQLLLLSLAVYVTTTGGSMATDIMTYEVTKSMVEDGSVAMSYNLYEMDAHRGVDGRYYAPYGLGHAIYGVPFYLAGRTAERLTGIDVGKDEALGKAALAGGSTIPSALVVWLTFWFAWRLTGSTPASVGTALIVAFATLLWPYSKFGFNAPLATLCVVGGLYGVWLGARARRPLLLAAGGVGLGCALLVRHELALVTIPVGVWLLLEQKFRWRDAVRDGLIVAAPVVVALAVTAYYNVVRFGNPFDTGYLRDETAGLGSFWAGAAGLLVSPGGSLFVYTPVALLGVAALVTLFRRDRNTAILLAGVSVVLLLFYATLQHWDADRSYGPRYLLPIIPLLLVPLALWLAGSLSPGRRRLLAVVVAFSAVVQLPGVLVDFSKVGSTPETGGRPLEARRWDPGSTALAVNTRATVEAVPDNIAYLFGAPRPVIEPADGRARGFSQQLAHSLDFWWVYLFHLGAVSAPVALVLGALPFSAAVWFGMRLRREVRGRG